MNNIQGAVGLTSLYDRWENTFWKTLMTIWFGAQYKIKDGTVSFTAVEERKVTGQEFSHQQSSQITRNMGEYTI